MRIAFLSVPFVLLAACNVSGEAAAGPGTRDYALTGFDRVALGGPDDVAVRVGPAASVRAEGDNAVLDQLEITVVGGELRVKRKDGGWFSHGPNGTARVTVTMPAIRGASVAGSGNMMVDRVKASGFSGAVGGSGDLAIATIESDAIDLSIGGSGDIKIAQGKAGRTKSEVAGAGSIDAAGVMSGDVDVSVAGSGDVELGASRAASVSLVGSGDVTITGGAKCSVSKVGSGDVKCG